MQPARQACCEASLTVSEKEEEELERAASAQHIRVATSHLVLGSAISQEMLCTDDVRTCQDRSHPSEGHRADLIGGTGLTAEPADP